MNESLSSETPAETNQQAVGRADFPLDSPTASARPSLGPATVKWLAALVVLHVGTASLTRLWLSQSSLFDEGFIVVLFIHLGLVLTQAMLVAVWLSMGRGVVGRLFGCIAAVLFLTPFAFGEFDDDGLTIVAALLGAITLLLLPFRYGPPRLRLALQPQDNVIAGLQFSIRGLMLLTAAVAIVLAGAPGIRSLLDEMRGDYLRGAVTVLIIAASCLVSAVALMWATLGQFCNWRRLLLGVAVGIAASALPAVCFPINGSELRGFVSVSLVASLALAGSLLMLRRAGFRLVRDPSHSRRSEPRTQEAAPHPLG